jgi:branched-chain amino acid transport system substrate-binding protein
MLAGAAQAEISDGVIRVGVLNDIAGVFQDTNGPGSIEAARMAAEDFAGGGKGLKVEIVFADHQNKPDIGSSVVPQVARRRQGRRRGRRAQLLGRARRQHVGARDKDDVPGVSTATSDLTGKDCSPTPCNGSTTPGWSGTRQRPR